MADILDPAGALYALISSNGPTSAVFTPNTQADITGDGDVDGFMYHRDMSTAVDGAGMYDTGAPALQVIDFTVHIITEDGNARVYLGDCIDATAEGGKNAGAGSYAEVGASYIKFGNVSDGTKVTFGNAPATATDYFWRISYDPAADTAQLDIYTNAARTTLYESSGALDMSVGPDSVAGGHPVFQFISTRSRGKGAAPFEYIISDVTFPVSGPPTEIRETLYDSTGTVYPNGTTVYCYDAAGALVWTGSVGSVTGVDQTNPSVVAPAAGEVVFTFSNGDLNQRWLAVDPATDTDGLSTNLVTPIQLV